MTAQISDCLDFEGEKWPMSDCPLEVYLRLSGQRVHGTHYSTACIRGYTAKWQIRHGRLYLVDINTKIFMEDESTDNMRLLFPNYSNRVFAHWYTGTLRLPHGDLIEHVNLGFASVYEKNRYLNIKRGMVLDDYIKVT